MTVILKHPRCDPGRVPLPIDLFTHLCSLISQATNQRKKKKKPRTVFFWVLVLLWEGRDGCNADLVNLNPVSSQSGTGWVLTIHRSFHPANRTPVACPGVLAL